MIVLLTDFGQSEYVGVIKGVIYGIDAQAKIVDLCHDIGPQNIIEAAWVLKTSYRYFPAGTVFCCVVDPGVGTERKVLAVKTQSYYFLSPDNGLLWETLKDQAVIAVRQMPIPQDAGRTFHGRDVFARAAAKVSLGEFNTLGEQITDIIKVHIHLRDREGTIVRIDRFGNIITNLPKLNKDRYSVRIADKPYAMNFYPTYDAARIAELFLIEGSANTLEISLKNGSANATLGAKPGDRTAIS